MQAPLISIVVPTKNSLPHLKNAIEGLRRQTYRNFEVIIQDGVSTDGTLDYLSSIQDLPRIDIRSEPDSGIGQAYNRGIVRCNGDFIFLAASDERLFDRSLERLLSFFKNHPSAAVIYGGVLLVNQQGKVISEFIPSPFDYLKFIKCELFPSTAGLLNRNVIGNNLFYDESLKTCPDYDFWLRLGIRFSSDQIIAQQDLIMTSLADRTSMSYRPESFKQFCKDKFFILDRFLASGQLESLNLDIEELQVKAKAGILSWAAREVAHIKGAVTPLVRKFCKESESLSQTKDAPTVSTQVIELPLFLISCSRYTKGVLRLKDILKLEWSPQLATWLPVKEIPIRLKGSSIPWGYTALATFDPNFLLNGKNTYWVKIRMKVLSNMIGVCFMDKNSLLQEKIFPFSSNEIITYYPIHNYESFSVVFRNSCLKKTVFEIYELSIVQSAPSPAESTPF